MKGKLRQYLLKLGWYEYIRYSSFFYLYQLMFKKNQLKQAKKELLLYSSFLPKCNLIFDIGAYDGHKTAAFLKFSKKVICCEPDNKNNLTLKRRFRHLKSRVIIEQKAVSDYEGSAFLMIHHEGSAFNTLSPKWKTVLEADTMDKWNEKITFTQQTVEIKTTTLDALIKKYGTPDFIKIDIEGYEKWALNGLTQKINYLSFESMLPDFKQELIDCLNRVEMISGKNVYNIASDDTLLMPEFTSLQIIKAWLDTTTINHFEVVVRMPAII